MTNVEQSYAARRLYPKLAILGACLFVVGTNAFVIAGLLQPMAATFGAHANEVSYAITFYSLAVAIGAPVISIVLPRLSRTTLMTAGLIVLVIGGAVAASAQTLPIFMLGRVVAAIGGAALVPTATAAAASLSRPENRGKALAFVAGGFTLATAFGAPLGTALGTSGGWQLPLWLTVGITAILAVLVPLFVRHVPIAPPATLAQRFSLLKEWRVLVLLGTTVLVFASFNIVYIFSSTITAVATGNDGNLLAVLLLAYGVAGIFGNAASGPLTDRLGSRLTVIISLGIEALALLAILFVSNSFVGMLVVFIVWGLSAVAAVVPLQHRLVTVDPDRSAITMSWYTTAMYVGIAIAPPIGGFAAGLGGHEITPVFGAGAAIIALLLFEASYLKARRAKATRSVAV